MLNRWVVIGGASGLAVAVLLITMLAGGRPTPPAASPRTPRQPGVAPPALHIGQGDQPGASATPTLQTATQYVYESRSSEGLPIRIFGDKAEPQPDFNLDVTRPGAIIYLAPRRVLRIDADHGQVYAPENHPQSGLLDGHVTLRLFEGPADRDVDLDHPTRDLQLTITFDQPVEFDLGLGQLESAGRVVLTGRQVEFEGSDLLLGYNDKLGRLQKLRIANGKHLRIRGAGRSLGGGPVRDDAPAEASATQTRREDSSPQFYRVRFQDNVHAGGGGLTSMDADELAVVFSLSGSGEDEGLLDGVQGPPKAPATADEPDAPTPTDSPQDLLITWSGQMIVEPEETPSPELAGPDDTLLVLTGDPVQVLTDRNERIVAAGVDYLASADRLRVIGSDQHPVTIDSPQLGVLQGGMLELRERAGEGAIHGPGRLRTPADSDGRDTAQPLDVTWNQGVDLRFRTVQDGKGPARQELDAATFRGDVIVRDDQFDVRADALHVNTAAADGDQEPQIQSLSAVGNVVVNTTATDDRPAGTIRSQTLDIRTELDERGRVRPTALVASGGVHASQPGSLLEADAMTVALGPDADDADRPVIRSIEATKNVRIRLDVDDLPLDVKADRLVADVLADQVEFFGTSESPALLSRADGTLSGAHIVMHEASELVHVIGPGVFTFNDLRPEGRNATVEITWADGMEFNNRGGQARFRGDVKVNGQSAGDTVALVSHEVRVEFSPQIVGAPDDAPDDEDPLKKGFSSIRKMFAVGDASLTATRHDDADPAKVSARVQITGPELVFDNFDDTLQVHGAGTMLVEDYRPGKPGAAGSSSEVEISGRGATLFVWDRQMTIDARHNDLRLAGAVRMLHKPQDGSAPTQLDCDAFNADLEAPAEGGHVGVWTTGQAPSPRVVAITAAGRVRVLNDARTINADQLRYTGADRTVVLSAAGPGKYCELIERGKNSILTAEKFRWNLARDRIEIERPGPTRFTTER